MTLFFTYLFYFFFCLLSHYSFFYIYNFYSFYLKFVYVNILMSFLLVFVSDEGVKPKSKVFCFKHLGAALYFFFLLCFTTVYKAALPHSILIDLRCEPRNCESQMFQLKHLTFYSLPRSEQLSVNASRGVFAFQCKKKRF